MRNEKLLSEGSSRIQLPLEVASQIYSGFLQPKGTASMFLIDYPVNANQVFLYNNDADGSEPQLLYRKVGEIVEFATDFNGFYNMNILSGPPYIKKIIGGGKRKRRTKKRKINRKRKTRRY